MTDAKNAAGHARTFWKVFKTLIPADIAAEAGRPVSVALVGTVAARADAARRIFGNAPADKPRPLLRGYETVGEEHGFPQAARTFDIVIDAGGGRAGACVAVPGLYSVEEIGGWEPTVERILDEHPDLRLALARRYPGLRPAVSRRVIQETAVANAEFAVLNALPGVIPLLGLLLPTSAIGDMLLLAKNQAMMMLKLAAAHELPLDMQSRAADLAPLAGSAFGWRGIAREVVGLVPGGIGMAAKGAVAYAGTVALGESMRRYYALGHVPTGREMNMLFREAWSNARMVTGRVLRRLPARRPRRKAIPPADPDA